MSRTLNQRLAVRNQRVKKKFTTTGNFFAALAFGSGARARSSASTPALFIETRSAIAFDAASITLSRLHGAHDRRKFVRAEPIGRRLRASSSLLE